MGDFARSGVECEVRAGKTDLVEYRPKLLGPNARLKTVDLLQYPTNFPPKYNIRGPLTP